MQNQRRWPLVALLVTTFSLLIVAVLASLDWLGVGPNMGLHVGYYGRLNRVLDRIEASPKVEVLGTTLHRDMQLEDFYISVRTEDQREVRLCFEEAHTRPFPELLKELEKVGL